MAARNFNTPSMNAARPIQIGNDQRDVDPYLGLGLNGKKETRVEVAGSTWEPSDKSRQFQNPKQPNGPNSSISMPQ